MIFNVVQPGVSHTVLDIKAPVRLICLGHAGLAPGIYTVEGDLRPKFITEADQRLILAGLLTVTYHEAGAPTTPYVGVEQAPPKSEMADPQVQAPQIEIKSVEKARLVSDTKTEGTAVIEGNYDEDNEPIVILDDKPKKRGRPAKAKETVMQPVEG